MEGSKKIEVLESVLEQLLNQRINLCIRLEEVACIGAGTTEVELVPIFGARCGRRLDRIGYIVHVESGISAWVEESRVA